MINYAKKGILIGNSQCANYYDVVLPQNKFAEIYNIDTTTQHRRVVNADFEIKLWYNLNARQEAYGTIINNPPKEFSNMKATHKSKPVILRNPNSDNIIINKEEER